MENSLAGVALREQPTGASLVLRYQKIAGIVFAKPPFWVMIEALSLAGTL